MRDIGRMIRNALKYGLSILPEIGLSECCRTLALMFLLRTDIDEYQDGDNIWDHLRQLNQIVGECDAEQ